MRFPCTGCGACCWTINRHESHIVRDDPEHPFYFPYQWDETGKCENLDADNKCKVYDSRPLLCNVDGLIDALGLDRKAFHDINIKSCWELADEFKLGDDARPIMIPAEFYAETPHEDTGFLKPNLLYEKDQK